MKVLKIEWHHNIFLYSFFFWAIKASDGSGTYPKIDFSDAWIKLNKGVFKPVHCVHFREKLEQKRFLAKLRFEPGTTRLPTVGCFNHSATGLVGK